MAKSNNEAAALSIVANSVLRTRSVKSWTARDLSRTRHHSGGTACGSTWTRCPACTTVGLTVGRAGLRAGRDARSPGRTAFVLDASASVEHSARLVLDGIPHLSVGRLSCWTRLSSPGTRCAGSLTACLRGARRAFGGASFAFRLGRGSPRAGRRRFRGTALDAGRQQSASRVGPFRPPPDPKTRGALASTC